MKIILVILLATINLFAQITIDSATVIVTDNMTRMYGRATFANTPSASEYTIGFLFGESYNDLNYVPMGDYSWNGTDMQLTFWTDITNLELSSKHYYTPYIQPNSQVRKFEIDGTDGEKEDIVCEPVIESASGTLRGDIGEQLTFSVTMENREEECSYNYQWAYRLATEVENYDTTFNESMEVVGIDTSFSYTYPESWTNTGTNSSEWTTPALQAQYNRAQVRVRAYNSFGEDFKHGTIIVIGD